MMCSCARNEYKHLLTFDNDNPIEVDLEQMDYVLLNNVGSIDRVDCSLDRLIILASNKLLLVNKDGSMPRYVSSLGRAKEEYLGIWDAGFMNNKVYIYDLSGGKILFFDKNGDYLYSKILSRTPLDNPFQLFIKLDSLDYIGRCSYCGLEGYPELALYDKNFSFIKYIDEKMTLNSGLKIGFPFCSTSRSSVLYNRYFDNEVYEITKDSAFVRYKIDFGRYNFKRKESKSDYDIIESLRNSKQDYATLISNMEEIENDYFAFAFLFPNSRRIGLYKMKSNKGEVISFKCREDEVLAYVKTFDFVIYALTQTENGITRLYKIPLSGIMKSANL